MADKRTALYGFHISHYAKMVSFAGWDMPMNYEAGIKAEHLATRHEAGLFDVSHMAQITLAGKNAGKRRWRQLICGKPINIGRLWRVWIMPLVIGI